MTVLHPNEWAYYMKMGWIKDGRLTEKYYEDTRKRQEEAVRKYWDRKGKG